MGLERKGVHVDGFNVRGTKHTLDGVEDVVVEDRVEGGVAGEHGVAGTTDAVGHGEVLGGVVDASLEQFISHHIGAIVHRISCILTEGSEVGDASEGAEGKVEHGGNFTVGWSVQVLNEIKVIGHGFVWQVNACPSEYNYPTMYVHS